MLNSIRGVNRYNSRYKSRQIRNYSRAIKRTRRKMAYLSPKIKAQAFLLLQMEKKTHETILENWDILKKRSSNWDYFVEALLDKKGLSSKISYQPKHDQRPVKITYRGTFPSVYLYLDGKYKARIYKGKPFTVNLKTGKKRKLKLRYGRYTSEIDFYLNKYSKKKNHSIYMSGPSIRKLKLRYSGNYPVVYAYENGRYRGKVYRHKYLTLKREAGKKYKIKMKYGKKEITRTIYLPLNKDKVYTFYKPRK